MGLGSGDNDVVVDDGDGGGGGKSFGLVSCSICLEVVTDNLDRSWAKLHCGHQFHLDCIGSAFNIKGVMQCPNCRKVEKGQWLYANGCRSLPEFSMDDWAHDEDLYDLSYSEMSFHWCPYGSLARLPSFFEEGEFSSNAYHDPVGQHAMFAERTTAVTSTSHPCPYIAYFGPVHPSSSNSSASVSEGPNYNNHWNSPSVPNEIPSSYPFPAMGLPYHGWEHHSPHFSSTSSRMSSADQSSVAPVSQRPSRSSSELLRPGSFMHPFIVGHGSSARAGSSVSSSMVPPYQGSNARARDRVQALQAYYQQQPGNSVAIRMPVMSGSRRSGSHRGLLQTVPSSSDQNGFYLMPPGTSGWNFQEADNPPNRFRGWDRDHLPPFSLNPLERDAVGWGTFHQATGGGLEPRMRSSSLGQRHHVSERMPSQNR
ncbi:RING/U-box superfamily protein [Euphorbia peplus]|nr:RING/U-box superfamily protein [Euphorbia peplus]